jgi:hypothetical protein
VQVGTSPISSFPKRADYPFTSPSARRRVVTRDAPTPEIHLVGDGHDPSHGRPLQMVALLDHPADTSESPKALARLQILRQREVPLIERERERGSYFDSGP